jgi:hypothetical protein
MVILSTPTGTVYFAIAIVMVTIFSLYLLYEFYRMLRGYTQGFTGELFGEPENKFLVGGTLCCKARYRGYLKNGYFTTKIRPDILDTIHDTDRNYEWLPDYNTNCRRSENPDKESGRLNGRGSGWLRKSHNSIWGHKIPFMYPAGNYTGALMVFDDTSPSVPLATVPLIFTILNEDMFPMRGWTSRGEMIPSGRSMFVKKPRKRNWLGTLS